MSYSQRRLAEARFVVFDLTNMHPTVSCATLQEAVEECDRLRAKDRYRNYQIYQPVEHDKEN